MIRLPVTVLVLFAGCGTNPTSVDPIVDAPVTIHPDSALVDAPAAASCVGSTATFCEDFEDLALGAATSPRWTTETAGGTLTIDAARARGTRSLHVGTTGNGRARILVPIAPAGNSMFGRMYAYVTAFPTAPAFAHYTLVEASGTGSTLVRPIGGQYATNVQPAGNFYGPGSDGGASGDWTNWQTSAPAVAGAWVCLEWQLSAATNRIDVWIDGVSKPALTTSPTQHPNFVFPSFQQIWFGWWLYQANPSPNTYELWIDDIVIDTAKIGC